MPTRANETIYGGRQRARIIADGVGTGFGGRTLCSQRVVPEAAYDVSVMVKLDDEAGAQDSSSAAMTATSTTALLTGGKLRLALNGPDVFS